MEVWKYGSLEVELNNLLTNTSILPYFHTSILSSVLFCRNILAFDRFDSHGNSSASIFMPWKLDTGAVSQDVCLALALAFSLCLIFKSPI